MIKLYGANASPFVRKVMAVLAIKQLPYEHIPSMPFSGDKELAKVSPLSKVPALIDGDLNIAEPGALIGFAGPRVIEQTIRQSLPEGFQRSEFLLAKGFLDMVVPRTEMKSTVARCLRHLAA